jgi:hypothetical protein
MTIPQVIIMAQSGQIATLTGWLLLSLACLTGVFMIHFSIIRKMAREQKRRQVLREYRKLNLRGLN